MIVLGLIQFVNYFRDYRQTGRLCWQRR